MDDASAFVPLAIIRLPSSDRFGHVEVIVQPDRIMPSSKVSQPVDASPLASDSLCLNAYQTVIGKSSRADCHARANTERKPSSKN